MSADNDIAKVLAGELGQEAGLQRVTLRAAIQKQIICPFRGLVLDVRESVLVEFVKNGEPPAARVMHCSAYDLIASDLRKAAEQSGVTVNVIDGRTLFAGEHQ